MEGDLGSLKRLLREASSATKSRVWSKALRCYEECITACEEGFEPCDVALYVAQARHGMARVYYMQGKYESCLEQSQVALGGHTHDSAASVPVLLLAAKSALLTGMPGIALEHASKVLSYKQQDAEALSIVKDSQVEMEYKRRVQGLKEGDICESHTLMESLLQSLVAEDTEDVVAVLMKLSRACSSSTEAQIMFQLLSGYHHVMQLFKEGTFNAVASVLVAAGTCKVTALPRGLEDKPASRDKAKDSGKKKFMDATAIAAALVAAAADNVEGRSGLLLAAGHGSDCCIRVRWPHHVLEELTEVAESHSSTPSLVECALQLLAYAARDSFHRQLSLTVTHIPERILRSEASSEPSSPLHQMSVEREKDTHTTTGRSPQVPCIPEGEEEEEEEDEQASKTGASTESPHSLPGTNTLAALVNKTKTVDSGSKPQALVPIVTRILTVVDKTVLWLERLPIFGLLALSRLMQALSCDKQSRQLLPAAGQPLAMLLKMYQSIRHRGPPDSQEATSGKAHSRDLRRPPCCSASHSILNALLVLSSLDGYLVLTEGFAEKAPPIKRVAASAGPQRQVPVSAPKLLPTPLLGSMAKELKQLIRDSPSLEMPDLAWDGEPSSTLMGKIPADPCSPPHYENQPLHPPSPLHHSMSLVEMWMHTLASAACTGGTTASKELYRVDCTVLAKEASNLFRTSPRVMAAAERLYCALAQHCPAAAQDIFKSGVVPGLLGVALGGFNGIPPPEHPHGSEPGKAIIEAAKPARSTESALKALVCGVGLDMELALKALDRLATVLDACNGHDFMRIIRLSGVLAASYDMLQGSNRPTTPLMGSKVFPAGLHSITAASLFSTWDAAVQAVSPEPKRHRALNPLGGASNRVRVVGSKGGPQTKHAAVKEQQGFWDAARVLLLGCLERSRRMSKLQPDQAPSFGFWSTLHSHELLSMEYMLRKQWCDLMLPTPSLAAQEAAARAAQGPIPLWETLKSKQHVMPSVTPEEGEAILPPSLMPPPGGKPFKRSSFSKASEVLHSEGKSASSDPIGRGPPERPSSSVAVVASAAMAAEAVLQKEKAAAQELDALVQQLVEDSPVASVEPTKMRLSFRRSQGADVESLPPRLSTQGAMQGAIPAQTSYDPFGQTAPRRIPLDGTQLRQNASQVESTHAQLPDDQVRSSQDKAQRMSLQGGDSCQDMDETSDLSSSYSSDHDHDNNWRGNTNRGKSIRTPLTESLAELTGMLPTSTQLGRHDSPDSAQHSVGAVDTSSMREFLDIQEDEVPTSAHPAQQASSRPSSSTGKPPRSRGENLPGRPLSSQGTRVGASLHVTNFKADRPTSQYVANTTQRSCVRSQSANASSSKPFFGGRPISAAPVPRPVHGVRLRPLSAFPTGSIQANPRVLKSSSSSSPQTSEAHSGIFDMGLNKMESYFAPPKSHPAAVSEEHSEGSDEDCKSVAEDEDEDDGTFGSLIHHLNYTSGGSKVEASQNATLGGIIDELRTSAEQSGHFSLDDGSALSEASSPLHHRNKPVDPRPSCSDDNMSASDGYHEDQDSERLSKSPTDNDLRSSQEATDSHMRQSGNGDAYGTPDRIEPDNTAVEEDAQVSDSQEEEDPGIQDEYSPFSYSDETLQMGQPDSDSRVSNPGMKQHDNRREEVTDPVMEDSPRTSCSHASQPPRSPALTRASSVSLSSPEQAPVDPSADLNASNHEHHLSGRLGRLEDYQNPLNLTKGANTSSTAMMFKSLTKRPASQPSSNQRERLLSSKPGLNHTMGSHSRATTANSSSSLLNRRIGPGLLDRPNSPAFADVAAGLPGARPRGGLVLPPISRISAAGPAEEGRSYAPNLYSFHNDRQAEPSTGMRQSTFGLAASLRVKRSGSFRSSALNEVQPRGLVTSGANATISHVGSHGAHGQDLRLKPWEKPVLPAPRERGGSGSGALVSESPVNGRMHATSAPAVGRVSMTGSLSDYDDDTFEDEWDSALKMEVREARSEWKAMKLDDMIKWSQTPGEVMVEILVPRGTTKKDVLINLLTGSLSIKLHWYGSVVEGSLPYDVKPDEVLWTVSATGATRDFDALHILMPKAEEEEWPSLFVTDGE